VPDGERILTWQQIWDLTEERWNAAQAETYVLELHAAAERVAEDPARGRPADEVRTGYRRYGIGSHLLFFPLELNRIDDAVIENALASSPALAHYRPWILDLRMDRPYQLEDRIEQLFGDPPGFSQGREDLFGKGGGALVGLAAQGVAAGAHADH